MADQNKIAQQTPKTAGDEVTSHRPQSADVSARPDSTTGTYDLENKSRGVRVVHDAKNQPIAVEVGQTRTGIQLHSATAKRLNSMSEKNGLLARKSGGTK